MKLLRALLVGVSALVSAAIATSTASAVLTTLHVTPSGAYQLISQGQTKTLLSNGAVLTCTASRIDGTISSTGVGTVALGGATSSGCTNGVLGGFTLEQMRPWTIRAIGELLANGDVLIGFDVAVPAGGWRAYSGFCTFYISGNFTIGKLFVLPIGRTITPADVFTALGLPKQNLVVESGTNLCSLLGITAGLSITINGQYRLNRSATVG